MSVQAGACSVSHARRVVGKLHAVGLARGLYSGCALVTEHSLQFPPEPFIQQRIYKRVDGRIEHEHGVGNGVGGRTKHVDVIVA